MLVFGDAATEAKHLRELRETVQEQIRKSKSRNPATIVKAICKKHGKFAQNTDVVELIVGEELHTSVS